MGPSTRVARNETVVFRQVGSEYLLVHGTLKQYHVLNSSAARVWDLATGERTVKEITEVLAEECGADPMHVEPDVVEMLEGLEALQLMNVERP